MALTFLKQNIHFRRVQECCWCAWTKAKQLGEHWLWKLILQRLFPPRTMKCKVLRSFFTSQNSHWGLQPGRSEKMCMCVIYQVCEFPVLSSLFVEQWIQCPLFDCCRNHDRHANGQTGPFMQTQHEPTMTAVHLWQQQQQTLAEHMWPSDLSAWYLRAVVFQSVGHRQNTGTQTNIQKEKMSKDFKTKILLWLIRL